MDTYITKTNQSSILSEEELFMLLGGNGEIKEPIHESNADKCNKCDKCDKCTWFCG